MYLPSGKLPTLKAQASPWAPVVPGFLNKPWCCLYSLLVKLMGELVAEISSLSLAPSTGPTMKGPQSIC